MAQDNNYLLRLNEFETNIKTTWQELQTERDFCDMTLACEDKQILTHKIIISSSSPIFRNILKQNSNPHPVIYLRGVKYRYLQNLINFMHLGEVNVAEEDLSDFLEVAEDLKIRGLSEGSLNQNHEFSREVNQNSMEPPPKRTNNEDKSTKNINDMHGPPIILLAKFDNEDLGDNKFYIAEPKEKNIIVKQAEKHKNNGQLISINGGRQFSCDICEKQYTESSKLRRHKESAHEGLRYPCDECDVSPFTQSSKLRQHKASAHEGVRYPCDECDVSPFTHPSSLRRHKAAAHEGLRYPCDQCDVSPFAHLSSLRKHKASAHEGLRYPCDQCDVSPFTKSSSLRLHKASVHEGVRYECDKCDYKATQKINLRTHTKRIHKL